MTDQNCLTCAFWKTSSYKPDLCSFGKCHRHAPVGYRVEMSKTTEGDWPTTWADNWCGDWQAVPQKPSDAA